MVEAITPENQAHIDREVSVALAEDIGQGDLTAALIPEDQVASARIISRAHGILAGSPWVDTVFRRLCGPVSVLWHAQEGDAVAPDQILCELEGPARCLLSGERCALNFLQTLSGTATAARRYVDAVAGLPVRILDTRKTVPGLRLAQKYAIRQGGGANHRIGLYDAVLIKENHIAAAGSISAAIGQARAHGAGNWVEVEVENLEQLREALGAGADRVMLDNFTLPALREAVAETAGRARLEASGGITLETVRDVAATGVDDISVGSLTKDVQALDLSMLFTNGRT
ncbi:MAG: carboxylating nicotinate-nucleotide diphosphorylase [Gammaproteobacteria bacterium]